MILSPARFSQICRPKQSSRGERSPPPMNFSIASSLASGSNKIIRTEQIRTQLQQFHEEAEQTQAKAKSARSRFMRLTEAAEKLRHQAALDVRAGKEDEARELLLQKRNVMRALEKSKSRVELLDNLLGKLNEAISLKETLLIGNVALDLEFIKEDASNEIRIICPKEEIADCAEGFEMIELNGINSGQHQELKLHRELSEATHAVSKQKDGEVAQDGWTMAKKENLLKLKGPCSYEEFLESLDQELHKVEMEIVTFIRISTIVLDSDKLKRNSKVEQSTKILDDVCGIRERIASIIKMGTDGS